MNEQFFGKNATTIFTVLVSIQSIRWISKIKTFKTFYEKLFMTNMISKSFVQQEMERQIHYINPVMLILAFGFH